ncbi:hypothetical protein ACLKA7_000217 [Drosophila subpalustris]
MQTVLEERVHIAILSELYSPKQEGVWLQSLDGGSAIWSYIAASVPLVEFEAIIEDIAQNARKKSPVIIAGDFNSWATEWGSRMTTPRGAILLDMFSTLNRCILNSGTKCTFSRAGREPIIDLTFASPELARISNWLVADLYTRSDHFAVLITIDTGEAAKQQESNISDTRRTLWTETVCSIW